MWVALIKRYWRVSVFEETPANTPYSPLLLGTVAFCLYILIVLQWMIADVEELFTFTISFFAGASLILSYVVYTLALLSSFRLRDRFVQTLTCLLAGHMIVHLFAFPLLAITPWLVAMQIAQPLALLIGVLYLILTLVLTVWQFMITVHIYKHALGIEYFPAVLASLGLLAANILVVSFWR